MLTLANTLVIMWQTRQGRSRLILLILAHKQQFKHSFSPSTAVRILARISGWFEDNILGIWHCAVFLYKVTTGKLYFNQLRCSNDIPFANRRNVWVEYICSRCIVLEHVLFRIASVFKYLCGTVLKNLNEILMRSKASCTASLFDYQFCAWCVSTLTERTSARIILINLTRPQGCMQILEDICCLAEVDWILSRIRLNKYHDKTQPHSERVCYSI